MAIVAHVVSLTIGLGCAGTPDTPAASPAPIAEPTAPAAVVDHTASDPNTGGDPMDGLNLPSAGWYFAAHRDIRDAVKAYMEEKGLTAGTVALALDGQTQLKMSFGYIKKLSAFEKQFFSEQYLPSNATMRLASNTKPLTAAVIHKLVAAGRLSLEDNVFNLGQPGGGVLPMTPWSGLGDQRYKQIKVKHLLAHQGGWDADISGDHTYRELEIQDDMNLASVPSRWNTGRWILHQPLQFAPGTSSAYSNTGYMFLGLVAEEVEKAHTSNWQLQKQVQNKVFAPLGVAAADVKLGATLCHPPYLPLGTPQYSLREPYYHSPTLVTNVFDPGGAKVMRPYGGWNHEARVGQGGMIATAEAMTKFLSNYYIAGSNIGKPRPGNATSTYQHNGSLPGTNAVARQRGDGYVFAVMFNERPGSGPSFSGEITAIINAILDGDGPSNNCRADLNLDGALDMLDWIEFQNLYAAGDLAANFSNDEGLDAGDLAAFAEAFKAGCP